MIKFTLAVLLVLALCSTDSKSDVLYTWDIPTQYVNGSALAVSDIDNYVIKYSINVQF